MTDEHWTTDVTESDAMNYLLGTGVPVESLNAPDFADIFWGERRDQLNRCRFTVDDSGKPIYTGALREALFRRCAHALALQALPLGVQASISDGAVATNYVGGTDAEVKRLEAPYRKLTVG